MKLSKEHVKSKGWAKHRTSQATNTAVMSYYNTATFNYTFITFTGTKHNVVDTRNALKVLTDYTPE